ncbi:CNP1-like family protein [Curvibacter sp. APW13]|uniref:CNP1-like family protein n=1 Tax=Curvibacter sp. APW13 TaxID=3077236 RepID=UPI0028DE427E|nr:CNP1-like family protein [Curvibacter sp. APW13]MDT8989524.1 CNP1-like family protein [Curvibacter sp. APW13]
MKSEYLRHVGGALLALLGLTLSVQAAPNNNYVPEVEWVEAAVPPAPAFQPSGGLAIAMPLHVSVKVAVDPSTVVIGSDGVVRYVAYMTNQSGSISAVYEGIRCPTDEVKTYARWNQSNGWLPIAEPVWKEINSNLPSKHAFAIARQGACDVRLPRSSVAEILGALKRGAPLR